MGKHAGIALILIFLLFFLPWLWGEPTLAKPEDPPLEEQQDPEPAEEHPQDAASAGIDRGVVLNVLAGGQLQQMDMERDRKSVV